MNCNFPFLVQPESAIKRKTLAQTSKLVPARKSFLKCLKSLQAICDNFERFVTSR